MKNSLLPIASTLPFLAGALLLAPLALHAQDLAADGQDKFPWYVRAGAVTRFNVKVGVVGVPTGTGAFPNNTTIYDDGYVKPDAGGSPTKTWNWGHTQPGQVVGNTVTLNRVNNLPVQPQQNTTLNSLYGGEVIAGFQLTEFEIGKTKARVSFEVGLGYSASSKGLNSSFSRADTTRTTDTYNITPPPPALLPYQGTAVGPGPLIDYNPPATSATTAPTTATVSLNGTLDTSFFDIRLGPALEVDLTKRLSVSLSAGFSAVFVDAKLRYTQNYNFVGNPAFNTSFPVTANNNVGSHLWHPGAFAELDLNFRITQKIGAYVGGEIQSNSSASFGDSRTQIKLDLGTTYSAKAGVTFRF